MHRSDTRRRAHHHITKQMKDIQKFLSFLHFLASWLVLFPKVPSSPPAMPFCSLSTAIVALMVAERRRKRRLACSEQGVKTRVITQGSILPKKAAPVTTSITWRRLNMPTAGQVEVCQRRPPDMSGKVGPSVDTEHPPNRTPSVRSTAVRTVLLKALGAGTVSKISRTKGTGKHISTNRPHPPAIL